MEGYKGRVYDDEAFDPTGKRDDGKTYGRQGKSNSKKFC